MSPELDDLIDLIFKKIKNIKSKKLDLEKGEFKRFIYYLLREN